MRIRRLVLCAAALATGIIGAVPAQATIASATSAASAKNPAFEEVDLVSDLDGRAEIKDAHLINPWGMSMGPRLWVSAADADLSTIYGGGGTAGPVTKQPLEVVVKGGPTGQVFNSTKNFSLGKSGPALFIFATESGTIQAWNGKSGTHAVVKARVRGAHFTGLTLLGGRFLLAADFARGRIVVFDRHFHKVTSFLFRDSHLPRGYHPFNVEVLRGHVYVAYAKANDEGEEQPGAHKGFVSRFSLSGHFQGRVVSRGALNAPWAMVVAPRSFGRLAGSLLVGNFGDGWINAYTWNGHYLGALRDKDGKAIAIPGLWDLEPGTNTNGGANALWFAAGIDDEKHGLVGLIRPAGTKGGDILQPPPMPYDPGPY
ncbi:TIGR03118 family protein [Streptosporangiaceae bacterium NEAU-GS5]|nr:TIGR03118 family protein [Streptosporangiaceae bacterium NEAU-GS5]